MPKGGVAAAERHNSAVPDGPGVVAGVDPSAEACEPGRAARASASGGAARPSLRVVRSWFAFDVLGFWLAVLDLVLIVRH